MVVFVIVDFQWHWHQWQITTGVVDTDGKFPISVTAITLILQIFKKTCGGPGKMIQSKKILWHCPLKGIGGKGSDH
jgi:hypothetical protein